MCFSDRLLRLFRVLKKKQSLVFSICLSFSIFSYSIIAVASESPAKRRRTIVQGNPSLILEGLYLGSLIDASDESTLFDLGITDVLNCASELNRKTDELAKQTEHKIRRHNLAPGDDVNALRDWEKQDLASFFDASYELIDRIVTSKECVLVHCQRGKSRSATMVIYYMMRKNQWSLAKTMLFLYEKRPEICPNLSFYRQLEEVEKKLYTGSCSRLVKIRTSEGYLSFCEKEKQLLFVNKKKASLFLLAFTQGGTCQLFSGSSQEPYVLNQSSPEQVSFISHRVAIDPLQLYLIQGYRNSYHINILNQKSLQMLSTYLSFSRETKSTCANAKVVLSAVPSFVTVENLF